MFIREYTTNADGRTVTHALVDDWYNHAVSFAAFLFGFTAVRSPAVTASFVRHRWTALGLAVAAYALFASYAWIYRAEDAVLGRTVAVKAPSKEIPVLPSAERMAGLTTTI